MFKKEPQMPNTNMEINNNIFIHQGNTNKNYIMIPLTTFQSEWQKLKLKCFPLNQKPADGNKHYIFIIGIQLLK